MITSKSVVSERNGLSPEFGLHSSIVVFNDPDELDEMTSTGLEVYDGRKRSTIQLTQPEVIKLIKILADHAKI